MEFWTCEKCTSGNELLAVCFFLCLQWVHVGHIPLMEAQSVFALFA